MNSIWKLDLSVNPLARSLSLIPPNRLTFSWGKDWFLSFELSEQEGKTEFTLIHGGWDIDKVTEFGQPHGAIRENMAQGWAGMVQKLRAFIEA